MKLTAKNCPFLKAAKAQFNAAIYKDVLHIVNRDGEQAAIIQLGYYSRRWYQKAIDMGLLPEGHKLHAIWAEFDAWCAEQDAIHSN